MAKSYPYVALLFMISLLGSPAYSQVGTPDERFTDASVAASDALAERIRQESRQLRKHDWAGEYYFGDGLGVNVSLALAPKSGFVFTWHGCLGLYDLNQGDVAVRNGVLELRFKYPNKREGFRGIAPELLPIRWGKRHYLIATDRIIDFTNAINAGTEPSSLFGGRSGRFLLKRGDEKKAVSGRPTIPPEFASYILAVPIKAKIVSVDELHVQESRRITNVRIDVGSADGLKKGIEFHVHNPSGVFDTATVTDVSEHSATAVIEQTELSDPVPSTGWELSTKL